VRAIIPVASLPAEGATLATIALGSETPQPITYTLTPGSPTPAAGTRLNITAQYHNHRALTGITINVTGWTDKDMPPLTTDKNDVIIANKADLIAFRDRVNAGENTLHAQQIADIDLENEEWIPIGNYHNSPTGYQFLGTYNGGGYTIKNMRITATHLYTGLFGWVGEGSILTGIRLEGVDINVTASYTGALVGLVYGKKDTPAIISHCTAQGTVSAPREVGGLVGYVLDAHITHCHAQCTVKATSYYAGGLIGWLSFSSKVVACSATGTGSVTAANFHAGGLIGGSNAADIRFCLATQTAGGHEAIGGFVGYNTGTGTITSCYATGGATGTRYAGTFAGYNTGTITHSHAIQGAGAATNTVGENRGSGTYSISTDPALRYATLTTDADNTAITALTVKRNPATGEAILPATEVTFRATDVWTNEEFPQIINNH